MSTLLRYLFSLKKNEFGYYGIIILRDIENDIQIPFEMSTDIPSIKATNITQQIGGAVTYTERYLLMSIFDIKDNNLDFDSQDNTQKATAKKQNTQTSNDDNKKWLIKWTNKDHTKENPQYKEVVDWANKNNMNVIKLRDHYKINPGIAAELAKDLNPTEDIPQEFEDGGTYQ